MNIFPIQIPTLAISVTEEALCLVEVKPRWRKKILHYITRVPLEPGTLKLSSAKPNIERPDDFQAQLQRLMEGYSTPISVALCLPDLCARTSIFDFTNFPANKKEQVALVNWRFQQNLKLDTSQSRLAYQVYTPETVSNITEPANPDSVKVLGTSIRHEIIEQFERICIQADVLPTSVGLFGLDTFDLYQPTIHEILQTEERRSSAISHGGMYLFLGSWGFTFLAFHDGCPSFSRTKSIQIKEDTSRTSEPSEDGSNVPNPESPEVSPANADLSAITQSAVETQTANSPYPPYITMKVGKEILATLQFYLETFPSGKNNTSMVNLFVATDLNQGHRLLPSTPEIQQVLNASGEQAPSIQVTPLEHPLALTTMIDRLPADVQAWSALPGFANLMVA